MVAAFPQDISVFLSFPCSPEVYLRCWNFLEGYLSQVEVHLTDIRQVRGVWPSRTSVFQHFSIQPPTMGLFPNIFSSSDAFLLINGAWGPTQKLKSLPPTYLYIQHNITFFCLTNKTLYYFFQYYIYIYIYNFMHFFLLLQLENNAFFFS